MKPNVTITSLVILYAFFAGMRVATAAPPATTLTNSAAPSLAAEPGKEVFVWKESDWKDPGIILPQIGYDGFPISEVIKDLGDRFKNAFDVLTPGEWKDPKNPQRFAGEPLNPEG